MLTFYLPQTFSQNANRLRSVLDRNLAYWESKLVHNHVVMYIIFDKMQYVGKDSSLFPRVMRQAFDK